MSRLRDSESRLLLFGIRLDHFTRLRFENLCDVVEHLTVGGRVRFLDTERTAVYQDSLAALVLGSEAECVFA